MNSARPAVRIKASRERLDKLLVARGYAQSRERAQAMILAGEVWAGGHPAKKAGQCLPSDVEIELHGTAAQYASRGGLKLKHALDFFSIRPSGWIAMDVGASTGGFTDCLLQNDAKKVYAVDVGYGQLAWKLRQDPRVVVIERTNIRHMAVESIPDKLDLITVDLSFISLRLVFPKLLQFLKGPSGKSDGPSGRRAPPGDTNISGPSGRFDDPDEKCSGRILALVKPQFEVGKGRVGRGGIVKDKAMHEEVLARIGRAAVEAGLAVEGTTASPLPGRKGNQEYFICLTGPSGRSDGPSGRRAPLGDTNILGPSGQYNPEGNIKGPA